MIGLPALLLLGCAASSEVPAVYAVSGPEARGYADPGTQTEVTVALDASDAPLVFAGRDTWPTLKLTLSSGTWVGDTDAVLETSLAEPTLTAWFHPANAYEDVVVQSELSYEGATWRRDDTVLLCPAALGTVSITAATPTVEEAGTLTLTAAVRTPSGGAPSPGSTVTFSVTTAGSDIVVTLDRTTAPVDANGDATVTLLSEVGAGPVRVDATAARPAWGDCDVTGTLAASSQVTITEPLEEDSG